MSTGKGDGRRTRSSALLLSAAAMLATAGAAQAIEINLQQVAWALADQLHATSPYTPKAKYSYNSTGGSITITRLGIGRYTVTLSGFAGGYDDDVLVTAYGSSNYCNTNGWGSYNAPAILVNCYAPGGSAADSEFTILYQKRRGNFGSAAQGIAFLIADQPTNPSYIADTTYQYNSTGGTNTISRKGTGSYYALLPGFNQKGGQVQVTAYTTSGRCNVVTWSSDKSGTTVAVQCVDASGAPSDQIFDLAYSIGTTLGKATATPGAYAWASMETKPKYSAEEAYAHNGLTTGNLLIKRTIAGEYSVTIPGSPSFSSSLVLVTGHNTGAGYCGVHGWSNTTAHVYCFDGTGTPNDTEFDVTFQTWK